MFLSFSLSLNLSQSLSISLSFSLSLFHFLRSPFSLSTIHTITSLSLIIVVNINVVISSRFSPTPNTFLHFFFPSSFFLFSPLMRILYVRSRVSVLCVYVFFPSLRPTLFERVFERQRSGNGKKGAKARNAKEKKKKRKRMERATERAL